MSKREKEIDRRIFLKNAALASAGLVISSALIGVSTETNNASQHLQNSPKSNLVNRKLGPLEVSALGLGCISMVEGNTQEYNSGTTGFSLDPYPEALDCSHTGNNKDRAAL